MFHKKTDNSIQRQQLEANIRQAQQDVLLSRNQIEQLDKILKDGSRLVNKLPPIENHSAEDTIGEILLLVQPGCNQLTGSFIDLERRRAKIAEDALSAVNQPGPVVARLRAEFNEFKRLQRGIEHSSIPAETDKLRTRCKKLEDELTEKSGLEEDLEMARLEINSKTARLETVLGTLKRIRGERAGLREECQRINNVAHTTNQSLVTERDALLEEI